MKRAIRFLSGVALITAMVSCGNTESEKASKIETTPAVDEVSAKADDNTLELIAKGKEIAKASFMALSGKLKVEMKAGGPVQAVPFCNVHAMPLTDSLSLVYDAKIERVATRYRNPLNEAKGHDIEVIDGYLANKAEGKDLAPQIYTNEDGASVFYAPIVLKAACISCHGHPESQVKAATLSALDEAYPNDKATGFEEGDLRGLWKITFNK